MLYLAELKKPHRVFNRGDLVVCEVWNGQGENMRCGGWSSKLDRIVANYVLRYQGSKWVRTPEGTVRLVETGQGHLRLITLDDGRPVVHPDSPNETEFWSSLDRDAFPLLGDTHDALGRLCYGPPEEGRFPDQRSFLRQLMTLFGGDLPQSGERRHDSPLP